MVEDLYLKMTPDEITLDLRLVDDLGIDSLGKISIFYEICDQLSIECDENSLSPWHTILDITNFIEAHSK
jgi:acyl carrier protein